jgi:FkbM family methyltransferase
MHPLKKATKSVFELLTGFEIERIGGKSFALIDKRRRWDAWCSYRSQLRWAIEKCHIDLVIDVGANEGQFGRLLRSFYFGEILSFEPVSSAFGRLAKSSAGDAKWKCYNVALGGEESTQTINVSSATVYSSLLEANRYCTTHFGAEALGIGKEVVSVRRFDALLDEMAMFTDDKRILLKLDTQGYDIEVLKGLGSRLKHVMALQSEVSLIPIYEGQISWTQSISIFEEAGFGVIGMFPVSRDSGRIIEYDCLLIRPGL